VLAAALLLAGACSSGEYRSGPATTRTSTTVAEVTLRAVVGAYSASARVLTLAPPVEGVTNVVVSLDTEVVRAGGGPAGAGDLAPRAGVEVTGRPGMPGTMVARRIVVL
jgi:hypothetical protein